MSGPLVDGYDLVVFDLDGVVFLIDKPIPGAGETVERLRDEGIAIAYATNNASRRAPDVAALLSGMGVPAEADEVLTSAAAATRLLRDRLPAGAPVLVVGAEALAAEVRDAGLKPVDTYEDRPAAVVQGYGPDVGWRILAEAALAVRGGAYWTVTNADRTLPSPRGPLPGNGSLVAVLRTALDREPDTIVGKPGPALFSAAATQYDAKRPLVVGDRLDTDIEGAVRAGMDALLVLSGISGPAELLRADASRRPTYVAADMTALFGSADDARIPAGDEAGGWRLHRDGDTVGLAGDGDPLDALRLLSGPCWDGVDPASVRAESERARTVLGEWGLGG